MVSGVEKSIPNRQTIELKMKPTLATRRHGAADPRAQHSCAPATVTAAKYQSNKVAN